MNKIWMTLCLFFLSFSATCDVDEHYAIGMLKTKEHIVYVLVSDTDGIDADIRYTIKDANNNVLSEAISKSSLASLYPSISKIVDSGLASWDASLWPLHQDTNDYDIQRQIRDLQ